MIETLTQFLEEIGEVGYVVWCAPGVVRVEGLPGAVLGERVVFESDGVGQVMALGERYVEVLVFSGGGVTVGERVARTGERLEIAVGEPLLGKEVNALGEVAAGGLTAEERKRMGERREADLAPRGLVGRRRVSKQMQTGVAMIDLMIPIGCGQRELVMGDRKTGKSYVLWQILINMARRGVVCVYTAIGKRRTEIMKAYSFFGKLGVLKNMIIVAASSGDPVGEIFLSPYTAMTIAEYFRDVGREVLVVLDDMTTHARFYRELSLVSKRFPGRDSYPGDIFYVHSKLLERAGNFSVGQGEASITCLPVVETVQGDAAGYIQTNLMSMTDGHIYFDSDLFFAGRRPAINVFMSVTRVGYQTQTAVGRDMARVLFELLGSYEKSQGFLRFGAELGESSRQILAMGDKVLAFFEQPDYGLIPTNLALVMVALLLSGMWDGKGMEKMVEAYLEEPEMAEFVDGLATSVEKVSGLIEGVRKQSEVVLAVLNRGGK